MATEQHRNSWESARKLASAGEIAGRGTLTFRVAAHPARVGILPRLVLRGKVREKLKEADAGPMTPGLDGVSGGDIFDLIPATHHQKLAVFDRTTLYIGGLDLDERRYDTPGHERPAAETWQDVQAIVTGPVVEAAQTHLETFEVVTEAKAAPEPRHDGFIRTLSQKRRVAPFHISPKTVVREIEALHLEAIGRSSKLIYLETQFLRHLPIAECLAARADEVPGLHLIAVLPAAPEAIAFDGETGKDVRMGEHLQAKSVATICEAFGDRALICAPVQRRRTRQTRDRSAFNGAPIVYVHSKVSIFDEVEATVSSANLNGRSMCWDTEAGVHLTDQAHISHLRERLFRHWMPEVGDGGTLDADKLVSAWRAAIQRNAKAAPDRRSSFLVPYDDEVAREFGEGVPIVPDELV
ncbi:phospholipase [Rhodophyticola sp. MJ-SS7]|nr:phospholipase [Rhodophyticola sp. MJ-SS7]